MFLTVKLTTDLKHILDIRESDTHGDAYRKACDFTDQGYPARVIRPEDYDDFTHDYGELLETRELGFNPQRGYVPNGITKRTLVKRVG